jgi:hypothetical protein
MVPMTYKFLTMYFKASPWEHAFEIFSITSRCFGDSTTLKSDAVCPDLLGQQPFAGVWNYKRTCVE